MNRPEENRVIWIAVRASSAKKGRCQYINANFHIAEFSENNKRSGVEGHRPSYTLSQEQIENWSQASVLIKALPRSSFNIILRKYRCQDVLNTSIWDSLLDLGQEGFGPYSFTAEKKKNLLFVFHTILSVPSTITCFSGRSINRCVWFFFSIS